MNSRMNLGYSQQRKMRVCGSIVPGLVLLGVVHLTSAHEIPPEIPKHMQASVSEPRVRAESAIALTVSSRREESPDSPDDLQLARKRALTFLARQHFTLAPTENSASFLLEIVVDPKVRYGMFHYQYAPYVYLTVRDVPSGHLVYCAYQRASHFFSATNRLLRDFGAYVRNATISNGPMGACAEQAKRSP